MLQRKGCNKAGKHSHSSNANMGLTIHSNANVAVV